MTTPYKVIDGKFISEDVDPSNSEPALKVAAVVTFLTALVSLVPAFFPNFLTETQYRGLLALLVVCAPFITAVITRGKVWSPASVAQLMKDANRRNASLRENLELQKSLSQINYKDNDETK